MSPIKKAFPTVEEEKEYLLEDIYAALGKFLPTENNEIVVDLVDMIFQVYVR